MVLNVDYISVVMQCLYASRVLVRAYLNPRNAKWVETSFNRRLRDFFVAYKEDFDAFDPTPFAEEALLFTSNERSFEYLKEHDPVEALERIFNALLFAQAQVVRDQKKLETNAPVPALQTFLGKYITGKVCILSTQRSHWLGTCTQCGKSEWLTRETQLFPVSLEQVSPVLCLRSTRPSLPLFNPPLSRRSIR